MQRPPSISVLLSVYNGETYLSGAIQSILNQTYPDFEFIIINDGSTDGTEHVIESFDDPRIQVITQSNEGLPRSLNKGVETARAPLIARMDADDWSYPDRLEIQKRFMDSSPEIVVAGSSFEFIDERDATVRIFDPVIEDIHVRRQLFLRNPIGHGTVVMRTNAVRAVGGYKTDAVPAEDYELWTRLARIGGLAIIPETLYRFRINPGGISATRAGEQNRATLEIIKSLWSSFPFPSLPVQSIVDEGKRYRTTYRRDIYHRYIYDQYALSFALFMLGKRAKAITSLYAAVRIEPIRFYLMIKAFRERRYYAVRSAD